MVTTISAGDWSERAQALAADGWWLADLCGVDHLRIGPRDERFGVVVQLLHHERKERQMIHVTAVGDPPTVPSIAAVWPTADFMEREAFDMFGIVFEGHPNLTRILMPDEWEGYPLRKDYGVGKVAVEFVEQPLLQISTPGQGPDQAESKVRVDRLGQVIEEGDAP
jgi:NADH-quinone oxidoreductase subunit C